MRKVDVARAAGVSAPTITELSRGSLAIALTPDRKRFYADHPVLLAYLRKRGGERPTGARVGSGPLVTPAKALKAARAAPGVAGVPGPADPLAFLSGGATVAPVPVSTARPPVPDSPVGPGVSIAASGGAAATAESHPTAVAVGAPGYPEQVVTQELFNIQYQSAGHLPADLEDLGAMTLREVVTQYGSLPSLAPAVKATKDFATMKIAEAKAREARGDMIERAAVEGVVFPLLDTAFKRIVDEAPDALSEQIIARVMAGTGDLRLDVRDMIRKEMSGILVDCKLKATEELEAC